MDLLNEENKVYKLIGPALVSVDIVDAKQNVAKRLEFIEAEIKKIDNQVDACTAEQNKLGEEVSWCLFDYYFILNWWVYLDNETSNCNATGSGRSGKENCIGSVTVNC